MSQEVVSLFFPETFNGFLKIHAPWLYDFLLPNWVADRCPMPSLDLQVPGFDAPVKVFWPVGAVVILTGFVISLFTGAQAIQRVIREGGNARPGQFSWSCSLLWYACMCCGGFFFHCLHVSALPHMLDLVGTGMSALSIIAGFAAYAGRLDDRTSAQRLRHLLVAVVFVAAALLSPPLLQEQLYIVPCLAAIAVGAWFMRKSRAKIQNRHHQEAQWWLNLGVIGLIVGLASVSLDRLLCVLLGAQFSLIVWFFLGCNVAVLCLHRFATAAAHNNLQFTDHPKS